MRVIHYDDSGCHSMSLGNNELEVELSIRVLNEHNFFRLPIYFSCL